MEIMIKSGSILFAKVTTDVDGTEGAILKTEYPLLIRTDSITMQPKLCISPSGVHNKIFLTSVDDCFCLDTFSFIFSMRLWAALLHTCSVAMSKVPLLQSSPTLYITGVSNL